MAGIWVIPPPFDGIGGLELYVSAFTSDPTDADNVHQNGNGLGTTAGRNNLGNDDAGIFGQLLSFSSNVGEIVGIELWNFGRQEAVNFIGSDTNEPPYPTAAEGTSWEVLSFDTGLAGNPGFLPGDEPPGLPARAVVTGRSTPR